MALSDAHPVMVGASRLFIANADGVRRAREAAEAAEAALVTVRALPADCPAHDYEAALRAAYRAVLEAHRQVEEAAESVSWMEQAVFELTRLAVARFGPTQTIVFLGYTPIRGSRARPAPRGSLGNPL